MDKVNLLIKEIKEYTPKARRIKNIDGGAVIRIENEKYSRDICVSYEMLGRSKIGIKAIAKMYVDEFNNGAQ